ncbi:MAG TPA: TIM barrel protein [Steroidobacteraceae bacterium]|nr:TIM barrel protein [Steroidobacteraceae bacterium]
MRRLKRAMAQRGSRAVMPVDDAGGSMIRISANLSTIFKDLAWPERFAAARAGGFDGVEMQFPYSEPAGLLVRAALAAEMPVVLINAPVDPPSHPFGIACRPERKAQFRADLERVEDYALALGARCVHVLAGRSDPDAGRASALAVYVENLRLAAERLGPHGIEVLIEPLNPHDAPGYLLDSFDLAAEIIARCGAGVGLQFDVYHATRMDLDVLGQIERALPLIRHIQFADVPGRHQPGTGRVPFERVIAKLEELQYARWLGAEYFPAGDARGSLGWLPN